MEDELENKIHSAQSKSGRCEPIIADELTKRKEKNEKNN